MSNKKRANPDATSGTQPPKRSKAVPGFRVCRPPPTSDTPARNVSRVTTLKQNKGRTGQRKEDRIHQQQEESPLPDLVLSTSQPDLDPTSFDPTSDSHLPSGPSVNTSSKPRHERSNKNATKLTEWIGFRDSCLDELLRQDARGDFLEQSACGTCGKGDGVFKCKDCLTGCQLRCQGCMILTHQDHPLHRIERWNGLFFERSTLQKLGLCVQLGHSGLSCPCPVSGPRDFTIFDISGIHHVTVNFCDCPCDVFLHRRTQLLRAGWFPATFNRPQTAFTFQLLDTFHKLTLQGETTLYDFYHTLLRLSDNAQLGKTVNRYSEFHRVFRIWRGLLMLKRGGKGQHPCGIAGTKQGELAPECPACPHPGKNLPDGWELNVATSYLYTLYLAVDANFKLKGKSRGISDVELMPGWALFVEEEQYQRYLADYVDQPEINTCESEHDAIVRANVRCTPGYQVTGTGLVLCSRHSLVRGNGVGDLQKGERYCNMDYIIFSALKNVSLPKVVLTYDIACQWSKNFRKRQDELPDHLRLNPNTEIAFAIPGWHINGHGKVCKNEFCLSYMDGVGRTCGEDIEMSWAHTNALGPSVREMGPGSRHETLNDHWGGWNFHKIIGFRSLFFKCFKDAWNMRAKHREMFQQLSSTFPDDAIERWTGMVAAWKADHRQPNPYEEPRCTMTVQDVRLQLTQEDAAEAQRGIISPHKMTLTAFLTTGLELEEQHDRRTLQFEISNIKGRQTSKQQADLQEKRTSLLRRIHRWREVQLVYMPSVAPLLVPSLSVSDLDSHPIEHAETMPLHLPSSLSQSLRQSISNICERERRLREAQADDALSEIRRQRRIIKGLWQFKRLNVAGTGNKPNTRMQTLYKRFNNKTHRFAERYRAAWRALVALDPSGSWSQRLRQLNAEDIRGPGRDDDTSSNGRFEQSWIWLVPRVQSTAEGVGESEEHFNESMREEWAKSQARVKRWEEEVLIIQEEMRRVIQYFEWKGTWWHEQGGVRTVGEVSILHGVHAYAEKQAALCHQLAVSCARCWLPLLKGKGIEPPWESHYPMTTPAGHEEIDKNGEELLFLEASLNPDDPDDDEESGQDEGIDLFELED